MALIQILFARRSISVQSWCSCKCLPTGTMSKASCGRTMTNKSLLPEPMEMLRSPMSNYKAGLSGSESGWAQVECLTSLSS